MVSGEMIDLNNVPLRRGVVLEQTLLADPDQIYYLYLPVDTSQHSRILVSVHGISRNAREHADLCSRLAERYGVILIAPLYTKQRHRRFQQLGIDSESRADRTLLQILEEVGKKTGADFSRIHMFGFSGGGQFVHRFALAYPERVISYMIGASGWYTLPDDGLSFPRGTGDCPALPDLTFNLEAFLQIPATVIVGTRDIERDRVFNRDEWLDRTQGRNRLERAENWITAMNSRCQALGIEHRHQLAYMQGVGHDFSDCILYGNLGERVFMNFYGSGDRPDRPKPQFTTVPSSADRKDS